MIRFEELGREDLWDLRNQIPLCSIYYADYRNSYGFDEHSILEFFDGYADHLSELMEEDGHTDAEYFEVLDEYDNEENLYEWYCCFEDFSWVQYDKEEFFDSVIEEIEDNNARWYAEYRKECYYDPDDISGYATEEDKKIILESFWNWYNEFMAEYKDEDAA